MSLEGLPTSWRKPYWWPLVALPPLEATVISTADEVEKRAAAAAAAWIVLDSILKSSDVQTTP
jgi:hypothetical protein